jgi:hypothetical protein
MGLVSVVVGLVGVAGGVVGAGEAVVSANPKMIKRWPCRVKATRHHQAKPRTKGLNNKLSRPLCALS